MQEKKIRLQNKMDELKDKGKKVIENIGEKKHDLIQKWEDKSRDFIDTFLLLFGREGRLVICRDYFIRFVVLIDIDRRLRLDSFLERR